ncbi:MAG: ATP-binding protein [Desulfobacterales bacterium]|nr:ATP-binding protein [Desulfobacterales bacterium]
MRKPFKAGMYLLETLTSGMYNDPLTIYREYVQNAVDSIDIMAQERKWYRPKIQITIDPFTKKIGIFDNGAGINSKIAPSVLGSIGSSDKAGHDLRGFRGIGRLGGVAFCEKAIFRTKSYGEEIETVQEWDCKKLRKYLSENSTVDYSLGQLFSKTTKLYQRNGQNPKDSFFHVELLGVKSFKNYIFNIRQVINYLERVGPVPFSKEDFSFGSQIDSFLESKIPQYSSYPIFVNDIPVYKPYRDLVRTAKKSGNLIEEIEFISLKVRDQVVAHGWVGKRANLLGSIAKGDRVSGIKVRVGNILIGDDHLLDGCFRENRFNGYVIGELHVHSPDLVPNSRRDDFVDNDIKTLFYNSVERDIGVPISKEIRTSSKQYSQNRSNNLKPNNAKTEQAKEINNKMNFFGKTINPKELSKEELISLLNRLSDSCNSCPKYNNVCSSLKQELGK